MSDPKYCDMPDIFHTFQVKSTPTKIFAGFTTSAGLDNWWTKSSVEDPQYDGVYTLNFGPQYIWKAMVTLYKEFEEFEIQFTEADPDWVGTRMAITLTDKIEATEVSFSHTGWKENNGHFRTSAYCWAMYLRILKRYIESGEKVPYEKRLSV